MLFGTALSFGKVGRVLADAAIQRGCVALLATMRARPGAGA